MAVIFAYAALIAVILRLIASDETCWNDYQLGLDDGPAKGKEAARITSKSFHCSVDMTEVRNRLPKSDSCYEVGVRNGALWQLQSLAVINQCRNDDFFNAHWDTEPVPNLDWKDLKGKGLKSTGDIAKRITSQGVKSMKNSFLAKPFRKSSAASNNDNQPDENPEILQAPQQPITNTKIGNDDSGGPHGRMLEPEQRITFREDGLTRSSNEPGIIPVSTAQERDIRSEPVSEQPVDIMAPLRSTTSTFVADRSASGITPIISQRSILSRSNIEPQPADMTRSNVEPQPERSVARREVTQQQEQRLISTGTDPGLSNPNNSPNSLLIPSIGSRDILANNLQMSPDQENINTQNRLDDSSRSVQGPQAQQVSIRTFKSESKTIV